MILASDKANAVANISASNLSGEGTLRYSVANFATGEANLKQWEPVGAADGNNDGYLSFSITGDLPGSLSIRSISASLWRNGSGAPPFVQFQAMCRW